MTERYIFVPATPTIAMFRKWQQSNCTLSGKSVVFRGDFGNWTNNYRMMLEAVPLSTQELNYGDYQAFRVAELEKENRQLAKALRNTQKILTLEQKKLLNII